MDNNGFGHAEWIVSYARAWKANPHYIANSISAVKSEIDKGYFVIIGGMYSLPAGASGHYAVVVGYEEYSDGSTKLVVNDPYGWHQLGNNNGCRVRYSWGEIRAQVLIAT